MSLDVCTTILTTYMLNALESDKKANWSFDICSPSHIWILYLWVVSLCTQQTSLSVLYPANIFFIPFELSMVCIALSLSCPIDVASSFLFVYLFVCLFVCCCPSCSTLFLMFLSIGPKMIQLVPYLFPIVIVLLLFLANIWFNVVWNVFFFVKMLALTLLVNI